MNVTHYSENGPISRKWIVQTATANMPSRCKYPYKRVAVIETDGRDKVAMISPRARGVVRIVRTWERLSVGLTSRCAYRRALADAHEMVRKLERRQAAKELRAFDPSI